MRPTALYTAEDLRYRPIEHVLECMTCRELADVLGCAKSEAGLAIRGDRELDPEEIRSVRRWLERGGATSGILSANKSAPASATSGGVTARTLGE